MPILHNSGIYGLICVERQGADITKTNEEDLFDVGLDTEFNSTDKKGGHDARRETKRAKKDQKYGFGGKKRHAKSNDAQSSADGRGFSARKMKGKPATGGARRPGKSKRAGMR